MWAKDTTSEATVGLEAKFMQFPVHSNGGGRTGLSKVVLDDGMVQSSLVMAKHDIANGFFLVVGKGHY